jgi:hypothetical protein
MQSAEHGRSDDLAFVIDTRRQSINDLGQEVLDVKFDHVVVPVVDLTGLGMASKTLNAMLTREELYEQVWPTPISRSATAPCRFVTPY